jgi:hypothetical protein
LVSIAYTLKSGSVNLAKGATAAASRISLSGLTQVFAEVSKVFFEGKVAAQGVWLAVRESP